MAGPLLVVGRTGQLAQALIEGAPQGMGLVALGRDELDLADEAAIDRAIASWRPRLVVNAAAYTAVDKAEAEEAAATAVNGSGPGRLAAAAAALGAPLIHVSTDYVFDGTLDRPYRESDPVAPLGAYGRSKLAGERAVAAANAAHVILRTAWLYSHSGRNFLRSMLTLASQRPEIGVVDDQRGNPTYAPDLAEAILAMARRILAGEVPSGGWGVFHAAGAEETTWCGFARHIFEASADRGGRAAAVRPITTAEFPTPARRPANSCLDGARLQAVWGLALPGYRSAVPRCLDRLMAPGNPA